MIILKILIMVILMLSPKQLELFNPVNRLQGINILSGVTGSGKSLVSNMRIYLELLTAPPNSTFLFSGNTADSLFDNVINRLLVDMDNGFNELKYVSVAHQRRIVVSKTGTTVKCMGANDERAKDRIQGGDIYLWLADEVVKQPKTFIEMAMKQCRRINNGKLVSSPIIWTCNPDSPTHFIKTGYIDKIDKGLIQGKNYFFGFNDNPAVDESYKKELSNRFSGVFYDRMIMGKWVQAEGSIYKDFTRDHVINYMPLCDEYGLGIDWGYEHPLVILFIGIKDGVFYVLDELYLKNQLIDNSLKNKIDGKGYKLSDARCDSSRPEQIRALYDLYNGSLDVHSSTHDINDGIQEVMFKLKKRGDNQFGLYIHEQCVNTIRQMENYRWKVNRDGITRDEPVKEEDDCPDALRYYVYSHKTNFDFNMPISYKLQGGEV